VCTSRFSLKRPALFSAAAFRVRLVLSSRVFDTDLTRGREWMCSMPKFFKRAVRSLAGLLILALAVVSFVQCAFGNAKTARLMACCAAMHGECGHMAISSCCPPETQSVPGSVATKPTTAPAPIAVLLAVLPTPALAISSGPRPLFAPDARSAGPPGVPTYVFVSSFRV
jgi:hypothetical protein